MRTAFIIITLVYIVIDLYVYKGLGVLTENWSTWLRSGLIWFHLLSSLILIGWTLLAFNKFQDASQARDMPFFFYLFGFSILFYIPKLLFCVPELIDDIIYAVRWLIAQFSTSSGNSAGEQISRVKFLYQVGGIMAAVPFASIAYGIIQGRWDFTVKKQTIRNKKIPSSFNGYKIIQISDAHLGSFFNNFGPVEQIFKKINELEPDLILFTGDMVNNRAVEAEPWIEVFKKLKAKDGKFSVLGNHDLGDYVEWDTLEDKQNNLKRLEEIQNLMGFDLMRNASKEIKRGNESINLLGIDNWGLPPFPQLGNMELALDGMDQNNFQVLMSHDPSHWDAEVLKNYKKVDLALAGHTHGMQFGVNLGNIKWSPVKYRYPRWSGLYKEKQQQLYVNVGLGYLGFPGRIGMPPEITLFELSNS